MYNDKTKLKAIMMILTTYPVTTWTKSGKMMNMQKLKMMQMTRALSYTYISTTYLSKSASNLNSASNISPQKGHTYLSHLRFSLKIIIRILRVLVARWDIPG